MSRAKKGDLLRLKELSGSRYNFEPLYLVVKEIPRHSRVLIQTLCGNGSIHRWESEEILSFYDVVV